jgi:hypothetical protein
MIEYSTTIDQKMYEIHKMKFWLMQSTMWQEKCVPIQNEIMSSDEFEVEKFQA